MKWINEWHPLPRYGLAACLVRLGREPETTDLSSPDSLLDLAVNGLNDCLSAILIRAEPIPEKEDAFIYRPVPEEELDPGKKSGQISANGVFIEPHVSSSNNAADIVKEIRQIIGAIGDEKKQDKPYELKRSFSPVIAKFNGGKKSMSNPKVSLLEAAFTAIGTATALKPAAFNFEDSTNVSFLPDLPFYDPGSVEYPLIVFIKLFKAIQTEGVGNAYVGRFDPREKRFLRPPVFQGNYPKAPRTYGFGAVSVLAAIGHWLNLYKLINGLPHQEATVISYFCDRPAYLLSYGGTGQQSVDHHVVTMAQSGYLFDLTNNVWRVNLPNVEERTKLNNPKWKGFMRALDQFLRFFHHSSWVNFLAQRAFYPAEFAQLFKTFFMEKKNITEAVVHSAMQYGKSLNMAAFSAAAQQVKEDQKNNRQNGPSLEEYKNRTLTQFESTIRSAKSATAMLAQMATIVGRLTMRDIHPDAGLFMEEVAKGSLHQETARDLIIAFMRLGTYKRENQELASEEPAGTELG